MSTWTAQVSAMVPHNEHNAPHEADLTMPPFLSEDPESTGINTDPLQPALLRGPLQGVVEWLTPQYAEPQRSDLSRRGQFLVITTAVFILFALLFVVRGFWLTGRIITAWEILLFCCLLAAANPFVMRYTGSIKLAGTLLITEVLFCIGLVSYLGRGILDAAFLINLTLPWLASAIIGPRASLVVASVIIAETAIGFELLTVLPRWEALFSTTSSARLWTLGYILVTAAMALLAWIYEGLTFRHLHAKTHALEQAHRELARGEARFRSLVQKSSDVITLLDEKGEIFYQSPSSVRVTGFSQVDLIGRNLFDHLHPEDVERVRTYFDFVQLHPGTEPETKLEPYRFRTASGEWRWLESSATNMLDDPNVLAVVIHTHDFTTHRLAQEELMRAKQEAERLVHARTTFLASLTHEVRTPLTSIIGFSNVLANEVTGTAQEFASLISKAGDRLLNTLNSILDFARLEAEAVEPSWTYVDLNAETSEVLTLLKPLAAEKGLELSVQAAGGPVHAWIDVAFYHRILNNLVGNALKFTDQGGVTVRLSEESPNVRIDVTDTGRGITEAFLPLLFKEFSREQKSGEVSKEGTGLGLAITKRLVELMDGTISVKSEPGKGTTFSVLLPSRPVGAVPHEPDNPSPRAGTDTDQDSGT